MAFFVYFPYDYPKSEMLLTNSNDILETEFLPKASPNQLASFSEGLSVQYMHSLYNYLQIQMEFEITFVCLDPDVQTQKIILSLSDSGNQ